MRMARAPSSAEVPKAQILRSLKPNEITCPAGQLHGDVDCYCGIEENFIVGQDNPSSIEAFCAGDYRRCPSWRADKDRNTMESLVQSGKRERIAAQGKREARMDRLRRAARLLSEDSPEARAFRLRTGLAKRPIPDPEDPRGHLV